MNNTLTQHTRTDYSYFEHPSDKSLTTAIYPNPLVIVSTVNAFAFSDKYIIQFYAKVFQSSI